MRKTLTQALLVAFCTILVHGTSVAHVEGGGVVQNARTITMMGGDRKSWDVYYAGAYGSSDWRLVFPGITVADLLVSEISSDLYQGLTNKGGASIVFLRTNADGCEFQVQKHDGGYLKSARACFKDGQEGVWMKAGYVAGNNSGRYGNRNLAIPYDFTGGTYIGTSVYYPGNIRVVGPISS